MARKTSSPEPRGYHHGQLRQALLDAAEAILTESGLEALTLRAAARRAGVSPAAPAHHFGSLKGLLTEVAILGFKALAEELAAGDARGGKDPKARLREQGRGYLRFALKHPGRFRLMFRKELLNREDPRLQAAGDHAYRLLEDGVRRVRATPPEEPLDAQASSLLLLAWSAVHGFAHLALEGQFDALAGVEGLEAFVATRLPPMLDSLLEGR